MFLGAVLVLFYVIKYPVVFNSLILFNATAFTEMLFELFTALNKKRTNEDSWHGIYLGNEEEYNSVVTEFISNVNYKELRHHCEKT